MLVGAILVFAHWTPVKDRFTRDRDRRRAFELAAVFLIACVLALPYACSQQRAPRAEGLGVLQSKRAIALGEFEVGSGKLVVADPGYGLETAKTGHGAILDGCRSGTWRAEVVVKHFGSPGFDIVSELYACHSSVTNAASLIWQKQSNMIGVDSGQAGVYDLTHFRDDSLISYGMRASMAPVDPESLWYSYCCHLTRKKEEGDVLPFGVVTSSGKGDGGYYFSIARDDRGQIIGVWIIFVDDRGIG